MKPYALWHQDETTEITSSQMLEELIDKLTMQAQEDKMLFSVQIIMNDDTGLLITVGSEISHLEFYSASHRPPVVISVGNWDETENEVFFALHGAELSTVNKKSCIPIGSAREAVRQYFETGKRPINISWTE